MNQLARDGAGVVHVASFLKRTREEMERRDSPTFVYVPRCDRSARLYYSACDSPITCLVCVSEAV